MSRLAFIAALLVAPAVVAAQAPSAVPTPNIAAAGPAADKVRCRRTTETGSLAKVHKECHTVAEWRQMAEAGRADARDMVDRVLNSTPGGN